MRTIANVLLSTASVAALAACAEPASRDDIAAAPRSPAMACADLAALALPDTTITVAEVVPAGTFDHPLANGALPATSVQPDFSNMPAFCRVAATVTPTPRSNINFELWMPTDGWNGKFVGTGNGGFWGAIRYRELVEPVERGFAAAATDHGHVGGGADASFARDPEVLIDFSHRAAHEMTVQSKAILDAYYGTGPRLSYWTGCTSGGRQGVDEVQRYPSDYDAVVAGAPSNNLAALQAYSIVIEQAMKDPVEPLSADKLLGIKAAALDACDGDDGLVDGVISDPLACEFDPEIMTCGVAPAEVCLTPGEVRQARRIYRGVISPSTGEQLYPGAEPSSEDAWGLFAGNFSIGGSYWREMVFEDSEWDVWSFDIDRDVPAGQVAHGGVLESSDPDLRPFLRRGGKLLMWHGWTDAYVLPRNTINFYEDVVATVGARRAEEGVRLFMAPGVDHCAGGDGPNQIDFLGALDAWAETGEPPETLLASKPLDDGGTLSRPLCPHPLVARYDGEGDPNDAASFSCVASGTGRD